MINSRLPHFPLGKPSVFNARRAIALALALLVSPAPALLAQVSSVAAGQAGNPMALHIVILDGENALNNIRQRTAREPIVQVEDENHKPIAGVAVLFAIRPSKGGAGGTFAGAATLTVVTGATGQAIAAGFTPNSIKGQFTIEVTATAGGLTTTAIISQTNVLTIPGIQDNTTSNASTSVTTAVHHSLFSHQFWFVAAGVAAAGAVVATTVVLTQNSGATITAGTGTVKP